MGTPKQNSILYRLISSKNIDRLCIGIIILGIVLRLVFYFQHRCLFIDEANVARNIYERGFIGLTTPLSYEQYAPPLFLWIVKCFTFVFGFGELSFRLFPLLCSIAGLCLLYTLLKKFAGNNGIWYPLLMMACGVIYVSYSNQLKQYSCDAGVVLSLLLLALQNDIFTTPALRFFGIWCLAGSVAIWLSMPSVFMLTGVGIYYLYLCIKSGKYNKLVPLAAAGIVWLVQFALYYLLILKPQIESSYLQNCHKDFFLSPNVFSLPNLEHNADVLNKVIAAMGGKWTLSVVFHLVLFITGSILLLRKHTAKGLLLFTPISALLLAAFTNQYALTPRLILFVIPLMLIIIGAGMDTLFRINFIAVKAIWSIVAIICIMNYGTFNLFWKRWEFEEITKSMAFVQQQKITAEHLYVHNGGTPAFIYYTTIHPGKDRWKDIAEAHLLTWNINYDSLSRSFSGKSALLFGWAPDDEIADKTATIERYHKRVLQQKVMGSSVFIFE